MGTIVDSLEKLLQIKEELRYEINAKDGNLTQESPFAEYPVAIRNLHVCKLIDVSGVEQEGFVLEIPIDELNTNPLTYYGNTKCTFFKGGRKLYFMIEENPNFEIDANSKYPYVRTFIQVEPNDNNTYVVGTGIVFENVIPDEEMIKQIEILQEKVKHLESYIFKNALKFTATGASTLGLSNTGNNAPILEKSTDGNHWETWDYSTISLADGESVYIKGNNPNGFNSSGENYSKFTMTGSIACVGNVMHLLGENVTDIPCDYCFFDLFQGCTGLTTAPELPATTLTQYCYQNMFQGCTSLTSAPELPATTLSSGCYYYMFGHCISLTTAPELPATTLAKFCYSYMFDGCTSLTTAPELPATTLANGCYGIMFNGCSNLTSAPELPATTLASSCYDSMFEGCSSLTTASELPATTLAQYCYQKMFQGCTSLTEAPELPAPTLVDGCYNSMFLNCSNLNYIKVGATSWSTSNASSWVSGVSSTGIFVKPIDTEIPTDDYNGIPIGWTVDNMDIETRLVLNDHETFLNRDKMTLIASSDSIVIEPINYPKAMTSTFTISEFDEASSEYTIINQQKINLHSIGYYVFEEPIVFQTNVKYKVDVTLFDFFDTEIVSISYNIQGYPLNCLAFNSSGASTLGLSNTGNAPILKKSTDGNNWETWDYSTISLADGESVYIKGNNPNGFNSSGENYSQFTMTGSIACVGNVMNLLGENVTDIPCDYCFYNLFNNCTVLTTAPELPATTLKQNCYEGMFQGCTSLTTAPELPATTLASACYGIMFSGCTSLTTAPELPATTLAPYCYQYMFNYCTGLTTAPSILPATTLANLCYQYMFQGCASLTLAPELPATTLVTACYGSMFYKCSNLNYIKVGATSWNTSNANNWVRGVSLTGTFVKPSGTGIATGTSGIPSGWTVESV